MCTNWTLHVYLTYLLPPPPLKKCPKILTLFNGGWFLVSQACKLGLFQPLPLFHSESLFICWSKSAAAPAVVSLYTLWALVDDPHLFSSCCSVPGRSHSAPGLVLASRSPLLCPSIHRRWAASYDRASVSWTKCLFSHLHTFSSPCVALW